ncbi:hypothetical protein B0H16DRAFT_1458411 [Mycena metata]|uniref:Uncharacterized protein n=1 Tax=Mycena metata TaxID=1033252 RepID=A0AAD7NDN7_9AGAR|nr:hypothetical protein B0H16DRAFT_1458411 [Mycena metata]
MPAFAFTFAYGSFGDILATGQLIVKIIVILRRGTRSTECAETEKELKFLGTDLANLTRMPVDDAAQASPLARSIADRVQEEIRHCYSDMLRFYTKINTSNGGLIRKLLWIPAEDRFLAAFRTRLAERRTVLGVLLGMLNSGGLLALQDRVIEGNTRTQETLVNGMNSLAQQLATYQQQMIAVIRQLSRGVLEDLIVVVSPAGVSIPMPFVYCRTFEVYLPKDLTRILNAYFDGEADRPKGSYSIVTFSGSSVHDYDSDVDPPSPMQLTASMELDLLFPREGSLRSDVWYRSHCARCGSPLATQQSLKCQVRLNSHCESFAQLTDTAIWSSCIPTIRSNRPGEREEANATQEARECYAAYACRATEAENTAEVISFGTI